MTTLSEILPQLAMTNDEPTLKVYVCGQVTGLDTLFVKAKFEAASRTVWHHGFEPVNPVELVGNVDAPWREAMGICLQALLNCEGIFVQEDWRSSKGAQVEIMLAHAMDLVFLFENPADIHQLAQLKPHLHPGWRYEREQPKR